MNQENLIGHSFADKPENRNKAGRPKKLPALIDLVDQCLLESEDGQIAIERMIRALIDQALNGSVQAARCILEFRWGKPKQTFDITTTTNGGEAEEKNKLILGAAGDVCDRYGNFICTIPDNKMHLFKFDIHFVDSDGVQAFDYDGSGIVSTEN